MKFANRFIKLLESQIIQGNYILIKPIDYSEVMLRLRMGDMNGKKFCEWYKVTNPKRRPSHSLNATVYENLKITKSGLIEQIPDEVINEWDMKYIVLGQEIMLKYAMDVDEEVYSNCYYIALNPERFTKFYKTQLTQAYLKPTNLSSDVKDTFSDVFAEL
jgi:response regulator RpfG family c-di-GMP phosphodiesterase